MATLINPTVVHVIERGTLVIDMTFTDETGAEVTPNSGLTWKLTDVHGDIVNGRSAVAISSSTTVTVALTGDDLALDPASLGRRRVLSITGTYDSSAGSNLAIRGQQMIEIDEDLSIE